jgi:GT2 family glycosyltransferase
VDSRGTATGEEWGELDVATLYSSNPILLSSTAVRRSLLVEVGGFAEDLPQAEDWDLWLRLAARGARFVSVPSARVRYRRHPGGLTRDVAALARAQLEVHRRREWAAGREALVEARALARVPAAARLRGLLAAIPLLRNLIGRRTPY